MDDDDCAAIPIVFVTNTLEPGGTERNLLTLSGNLSERFRPEIWSLFSPDNEATTLPVRVFGRFLKFDPLLVLRLAWAMGRHPARVFHVYHFAFGIHVLLANILLLGRKRLIFSFGSGRYEISKAVFWPYAKLLNLAAACITSNSASTSSELANDGIDGRRIRVVVNGHDTQPFQTPISQAEARQQTGQPEDGKIVVTTGRLVESKRVCDLIDAASLSDWKLIVIGDGALRESLQTQADQLGVGDRVQFTGSLEKAELLTYLAAADVFAFASETEGLPNSLIEAGLAGLPIVACNVEGVVDVVQNDRTGRLVPKRSPNLLNQEIKRILADTELGSRLGSAARKEARKTYSLDRMVSSFEAIYRDLESR